jgi:glucose-6-phosphate-specific signal transduction histidine kinase
MHHAEHGRGAFELTLARPVRRWFERRAVVLGSAALLTLATFTLRELASSRGEILGLLYVIPVALVGLELGLRAGVAAALGALLLVAVRPPSSDPALDALGLAMRGIALLSVGAIAGRFSDRMRAAQARLQEHFRSAEHVLDVHERERRGIADQLHEQTAQTMAAALLLVGRLERDVVDGLTQAQLEQVRDSVRHCIGDLRRLAVSLRPPVLDELGLVPALEQAFERHGGTAPRAIAFGTDGLPERLAPDTETLAYRVIEEILGKLCGAIAVHIALDRGAARLRVAIDGACCERTRPDELDAVLTTTRARLEIVGGGVSSSRLGEHVAVAAEIPLAEPAPAEHAPTERPSTELRLTVPPPAEPRSTELPPTEAPPTEAQPAEPQPTGAARSALSALSGLPDATAV